MSPAVLPPTFTLETVIKAAVAEEMKKKAGVAGIQGILKDLGVTPTIMEKAWSLLLPAVAQYIGTGGKGGSPPGGRAPGSWDDTGQTHRAGEVSPGGRVMYDVTPGARGPVRSISGTEAQAPHEAAPPQAPAFDMDQAVNTAYDRVFQAIDGLMIMCGDITLSQAKEWVTKNEGSVKGILSAEIQAQREALK